MKDAGFMQYRPYKIAGKMNAVEGIMSRHDQYGYGQYNSLIEVDQCRQGDHAEADGPDHLEVKIRIGRVKTPEQPDDQQFHQHQPDPSREQEKSQFTLTAPDTVEISGNACQENKDGRGEMGYPTRKKQGYRCTRQIGRTIPESIVMKVAAHMVQCHDDHDGAAQKVY